MCCFMRLDKYLKLSRLVKRRTIAQEMADVGAVKINGRQSKPSANVADGDILEISFPRRLLKVKVLTADESAIKKKAEPYELVEESRLEREEKSDW